jgi:hypothetical protein
MLLAVCDTAAESYRCGETITGTGNIQGKLGQGILEAFTTRTLSSTCSSRRDFTAPSFSRLAIPLTFIRFSKMKGCSGWYFLTMVQAWRKGIRAMGRRFLRRLPFMLSVRLKCL